MRVFVTGASGYLGSAIVSALVKAGHEVGGLYRSADKESVVRQLGAVPVFGHLRDPETYQHFAAESDAVIHAAFESPDVERVVAEHLVGALKAEGGAKQLILTSGVLVLGDTGSQMVDESGSTERPFPPVSWRPPIERYVLDQANEQLSTAVVRPGFAYGGTRRSVLAGYVESALKEGVARYIGPGTNRMAYVHRADLAHLYRLIVEKRARGLFHGVDRSNVTNAELAAAVAREVGGGAKSDSLPVEVARQRLGPFAEAYTVEQRVTTSRSPAIGWRPKHEDILADVPRAVAELRV